MSTTLGPWRFEAVSDACRVVLGTGRQKLILARLSTKQIPEKEVACNAKIMAASLDLLEACEAIFDSFQHFHTSDPPKIAAFEKLIKAIAKARGAA